MKLKPYDIFDYVTEDGEKLSVQYSPIEDGPFRGSIYLIVVKPPKWVNSQYQVGSSFLFRPHGAP
jgi:hypothetical protein